MQLPGKHRHNGVRTGLAGLAVIAAGVAGAPAAAASTSAATSASATAPAARPGTLVATTYRNPVSKAFADTYADPDVVRGNDGWWYAYATSDPLRSGASAALHPDVEVARPRPLAVRRRRLLDGHLADWADTAAGRPCGRPTCTTPGGQWRMYYVVTETTVTRAHRGINDNAIGMATAPSPLGPWTDSGAPVVGPRRAAPAQLLVDVRPRGRPDIDGTEHIFYGSYYGGIFSSRSTDGKQPWAGEPHRHRQQVRGHLHHRKNGYWYLFASTANCCAGPTTGYSVEVARSRR